MAVEPNSSPPTPEATHIRSLLIGSWRVKAILAHDPNDPSASPIPVFSEQPNGGLLYAQDGYMSAVMQATSTPDFASWHSPTPAESHATIPSTQCYMGRFYIDTASVETSSVTDSITDSVTDSDGTTKIYRAVIYHEPFVSLPPNWRGLGMQKRNAELRTEVDGMGREKGRGLVMRVETAVELGMWLPERERGEEVERVEKVRGERAKGGGEGRSRSESGEGGEDSGAVEGRKWRLEVRFERAEGNEGMLKMED